MTLKGTGTWQGQRGQALWGSCCLLCLLLLSAGAAARRESPEQWDRLPKHCDQFRLLTVADAKFGEGFFNKVCNMFDRAQPLYNDC